MQHQRLAGRAFVSLVTHGKFRDAAVVETQVEESRVLGFAPASEADVVQTGNRGSELAVSRRVTSSFVDENAVEGDGDVVVGGEVTACVLNGEDHRRLQFPQLL